MLHWKFGQDGVINSIHPTRGDNNHEFEIDKDFF